MSTNENTTHQHIKFISKHIDEMDVEDKLQIYRIIVESHTDDSQIQEKGAGIEVKFKHLSSSVILTLRNFIHNRLQQKIKELSQFPETD